MKTPTAAMLVVPVVCALLACSSQNTGGSGGHSSTSSTASGCDGGGGNGGGGGSGGAEPCASGPGSTGTGATSGTGVTTATTSTGSSGNITVACDSINSNHLCTEFNAPLAYKDSLETSCTDSSNGTVVDGCPPDNLLGVCSLPEQGGFSTTVYYYSYAGGPDAASLQQGCEAGGGTWSS